MDDKMSEKMSKDQLLKAYKESIANLARTDTKYEEKIAHLIEQWRLAQNLIAISGPDLLPSILHWAVRNILHMMLLGEWSDVSMEDKQKLYKLIEASIPDLSTNITPIAYRCKYILDVMFSPWSDSVLKTLLINPDSESITMKDQIELFTKERPCLVSLRVNKLCEDKCEDMALNLVTAYWRCFVFLLLEQPEHELVEATKAADFQNNVLFDYYLALLVKFKKYNQFQEEMDKLTLDFKLNTVQRMPNTQASTKELTKHFKKAQLMVASALVRSILSDPDPNNLNLTKSQFVFKAIVDETVEQQKSELPPSDMFYVKALTEWMKLNMAENENKFEKLLNKIMKDAIISKHLYMCSKALKEMYQTRFEVLGIELLLRGITLDLNQSEKRKFETTNELEMLKAEYLLSNKIMELHDLVKQNMTFGRECLLTAFSLNPCQEIYEKVREAASSCGHLSDNVGVSTHSLVGSDNLVLNPIADQLPDYLQSDILTVLLSPRLKQLSWDLSWNELNVELQKLLELPEKLNILRKQLLISNDNLKYLELDYSMFEHLPETEYPGIEKGFEIYLDSDSEESESDSDADVVFKRPYRRPKFDLEAAQVEAHLQNEIVVANAESIFKMMESINAVVNGEETVNLDEVYEQAGAVQVCVEKRGRPARVNSTYHLPLKRGMEKMLELVPDQNSDDEDAIYDMMSEDKYNSLFFAMLANLEDTRRPPKTFENYDTIINLVSQAEYCVDYDAVVAGLLDDMVQSVLVKRKTYNEVRRKKRLAVNKTEVVRNIILKPKSILMRHQSLPSISCQQPSTKPKRRRYSESDAAWVIGLVPIVRPCVKTELVSVYQPNEQEKKAPAIGPKPKPKRRFVDQITTRPKRANEEKLITPFERELCLKVRKLLFRLHREEEFGKPKKPTKLNVISDQQLEKDHYLQYPKQPPLLKSEPTASSSALDMLAAVACETGEPPEQFQPNISANPESMMEVAVKEQYATVKGWKIDVHEAVTENKRFYTVMQHLPNPEAADAEKAKPLTLNKRGKAIEECLRHIYESQPPADQPTEGGRVNRLRYSELTWFKQYCVMPKQSIKPFRRFGDYLRENVTKQFKKPIRPHLEVVSQPVMASVGKRTKQACPKKLMSAQLIAEQSVSAQPGPVALVIKEEVKDEEVTVSKPEIWNEPQPPIKSEIFVPMVSPPPPPPVAITVVKVEKIEEPVVEVVSPKKPAIKRPRKTKTNLYASGVPSLKAIATICCAEHKLKKPPGKRGRKPKEQADDSSKVNLYAYGVPRLEAIVRQVCAIHKLKPRKWSPMKKPRKPKPDLVESTSRPPVFGVLRLEALARRVCVIHKMTLKLQKPPQKRGRKPKSLDTSDAGSEAITDADKPKKVPVKRPRKPKPPGDEAITVSNAESEGRKPPIKRPRKPKAAAVTEQSAQSTQILVPPAQPSLEDEGQTPPIVVARQEDPIDALLAELLGPRDGSNAERKPKTMLEEILEAEQRELNGFPVQAEQFSALPNFGPFVSPNLYAPPIPLPPPPAAPEDVPLNLSGVMTNNEQVIKEKKPPAKEKKPPKERKPPKEKKPPREKKPSREKKPPKEKQPSKEKQPKATKSRAKPKKKTDPIPETPNPSVTDTSTLPTLVDNSLNAGSEPIKVMSYTEIILPGKFPLNLGNLNSPSTSTKPVPSATTITDENGLIDFESCLESIIPASVITNNSTEVARQPTSEPMAPPAKKRRPRKPKLVQVKATQNVLPPENLGFMDFEACLDSATIAVAAGSVRHLAPPVTQSSEDSSISKSISVLNNIVLTSPLIATTTTTATSHQQPDQNLMSPIRPSTVVENCNPSPKLATENPEVKTLETSAVAYDDEIVEVIELAESDSSDGCEIINTIEMCRGTHISLRQHDDPLALTENLSSSKNGMEDDKQPKTPTAGSVDPVQTDDGVDGAAYHRQTEQSDPSQTTAEDPTSNIPPVYRTYSRCRKQDDNFDPTLMIKTEPEKLVAAMIQRELEAPRKDFVFLAPAAACAKNDEDPPKTDDLLSTMNVSSDDESENEVGAVSAVDASNIEKKIIGNIIRQRRHTILGGLEAAASSILVRHDYIKNDDTVRAKSGSPRNVLNINMLYRIDELKPRSFDLPKRPNLGFKETLQDLEKLVSKSRSPHRRLTYPLCEATQFDVDAKVDKFIENNFITDVQVEEKEECTVKTVEQPQRPSRQPRKSQPLKPPSPKRRKLRHTKIEQTHKKIQPNTKQPINAESVTTANNEADFVMKNFVICITRNKLYDDSPPRGEKLNGINAKVTKINNSLRDHNRQEQNGDSDKTNNTEKYNRTRASTANANGNNKLGKKSTNFFLNCVVNMDYSTIFRKKSYADDHPLNFGRNYSKNLKFFDEDLKYPKTACDKKRLNALDLMSIDPKSILKNVPGMTDFEFFELPQSQQVIEIVEVTKTCNSGQQSRVESVPDSLINQSENSANKNPTSVSAHIQRIGVPSTMSASVATDLAPKVCNGAPSNSSSVIKTHSSAPLPNNLHMKSVTVKKEKVENVPVINILSQQILVPANSNATSPICTTRVKESTYQKQPVIKQQTVTRTTTGEPNNTVINLSSTNTISSQQLLELLNSSIMQQQQQHQQVKTLNSATTSKIFTTPNTTVQSTTSASGQNSVTVTGSQNLVQFLCKSDGRMIQLTPITTVKSPNPTQSLEILPTTASALKQHPTYSQPQIIVTRKELQFSETTPTSPTKSDTLPKFTQAFGRSFQPSTSNSENGKLPTTVITNNITKMFNNPTMAKRSVTLKAEGSSSDGKNNIRIINYDTAGHIINDSGVKTTTQVSVTNNMSNIKLLRTQPPNVVTSTVQAKSNIQIEKSNGPLRVSMPIIQQNTASSPALMQTRLPIIQLPQNVLNKQHQTLLIATPRVFGGNSPASGIRFENFVPTSSVGGNHHQQYIQIPVSQAQILNKTHGHSNNVDNSTLEQLREFDLVLEQVKERSCGSTEPPSVASSPEQAPSNVIHVVQNHEKPAKDLKIKQETIFTTATPIVQKINVAILQSPTQTRAEPFVVVSNSGGTTNFSFSPQTMNFSSSTLAKLVKNSGNKLNVKEEIGSNDSEVVCSSTLSKIPAHMTPLTISTTITQPAVTAVPKPAPKPLEDEQTVQRIYDILAGYAEQLRNSPDLNNKPAPRRRTNPPTNPAQPSGSSTSGGASTKRKKASFGNSSIGSFSSGHDDTDRQTLESEDSSCDVSNGGTVYSRDDAEVMNVDDQQEDHQKSSQIRITSAPQASKLITTLRSPFAQQLILADANQSQLASTSGEGGGITRNFLIASHQPTSGGQLIQNANGNALLMPRNYLVPINLVKNGQITILSSPKANTFQTTASNSTIVSTNQDQNQYAQIGNSNNMINITQQQLLHSVTKPSNPDTSKSIAGKTFILQSYLNQQQQLDKEKYLKTTPALSAATTTSRNNSSLIIQTIKKAQSSMVENPPTQPIKIVTSSTAAEIKPEILDLPLQRTESILMFSNKNDEELESGININDVKEEIEIFYDNDSHSDVISNYQDLENSGYVINMKAADEGNVDNVEQITIIRKVGDFKTEEEDDDEEEEEEMEDTSNKNFIQHHSTSNILSNYLTSHAMHRNSTSGCITYNPKKLILNENRKFGFYDSQMKKNLHKHKQSAAEREFLLQKSLSEECEDLGVDEPSTSDLFPEADLLFDPNSPTCSVPNSAHLDQSSQESLTENSEKKMKSISVNSYLRHYSQSEESVSTIQQLTPTTTRFPVKFMNKIRDLNRENDLIGVKRPSEAKMMTVTKLQTAEDYLMTNKSIDEFTLSTENILNDSTEEESDNVFETTNEVGKSIHEVEMKLQNDRKFKKFLLRSKSLASQHQQQQKPVKSVSLSLSDELGPRKRQLEEATATAATTSMVTVKKIFLSESKVVTDKSGFVKTSVSKTNTFVTNHVTSNVVTTTSKVLTTKCVKRTKRR